MVHFQHFNLTQVPDVCQHRRQRARRREGAHGGRVATTNKPFLFVAVPCVIERTIRRILAPSLKAKTILTAENDRRGTVKLASADEAQ